MGSWVVKQPNGTFARFSEVVDDFTHFNLSRAEMKAELAREHGKEAAVRALAQADKDKPRWKPHVSERTNWLWHDALHVMTTLGKHNAVHDAEKQDREHKPEPEPELTSKGSWCPQCGPNVKVDEDGLCAACGATAMGEGTDKALTAIDELKTLKRKARKLLKDDYSALEFLGILTTRDKPPLPEGDE